MTLVWILIGWTVLSVPFGLLVARFIDPHRKD